MGSAKPLPPIHPADAERFFDLVDRRGPDECWPFLGGLCAGYGSFRLGKRKVRAHRVAWVMWSGEPEPDAALHLDHACHDPKVCRGGRCPHRCCCNPRHLRAVTPKQNVANSNARAFQLAERLSCARGHRFDERNTRVDPRTGVRACRLCQATDARVRRPLIGRRADFDTRCPHGHEWTDANTYRFPNGQRACRTCMRSNARAYKARKRAAAATLRE